jgi:hypothetical protein
VVTGTYDQPVRLTIEERSYKHTHETKPASDTNLSRQPDCEHTVLAGSWNVKVLLIIPLNKESISISDKDKATQKKKVKMLTVDWSCH